MKGRKGNDEGQRKSRRPERRALNAARAGSSGKYPSLRPVARNVLPASISKLALRRQLGWRAGAALSVAVLLLVLSPGQEHWRAPGTMNVGHEALTCEQCHQPAAGTPRQQLQANARYLLGLRQTPADFGNQDVTNADCLACHERPFDRHPVFRFNEPRFEDARATLGAHRCESCHSEHRGVKVVREPGYCRTCHQDLALEADPIDVPHERLVEQERWDTCLGCHDFHGNHERRTPKKLAEAINTERIRDYFQGAPSPFGSQLKSPPRKERANASAIHY